MGARAVVTGEAAFLFLGGTFSGRKGTGDCGNGR